MLILDFVDERENIKKQKKRFYKKRATKNDRELKRYSIKVNEKVVVVLELAQKDLKSSDVLTLLKIYKGRVLVSTKYQNEEILKEYLYNPQDYYQRALLSSIINQIKSVNRAWKTIAVKIDDFSPFKEFYELVSVSKEVTILTEENAYTEKLIRDCYYEYGAIVNVKNEISIYNKDVFIDLNEVDYNGKLMINVNGKDLLLYPDNSYFDDCIEYQKLLAYNIDHNIICAAFSTE